MPIVYLYRYLQWTSLVSGQIKPVFDLSLLFHLSYFVIIHLHLIHANILFFNLFNNKFFLIIIIIYFNNNSYLSISCQ